MKMPGENFLKVAGIFFIIVGVMFAFRFSWGPVLFGGYLLFVGIMSVKFCRNAGKAVTLLCVLGIGMTIPMGASIIWVIIDERIRMEAALGVLAILVLVPIPLVFSTLLFIGAIRNKLAYRRAKRI